MKKIERSSVNKAIAKVVLLSETPRLPVKEWDVVAVFELFVKYLDKYEK